MKNIKYLLVACVLAATSAWGEDKAKSLDELLRLVQSAKVNESSEHRQREAEFNKAKDRQVQLLSSARGLKAAEEQRSDQMEKTFADNELQIDVLRVQLDKRLGTLKELFGHLTSAAGDARASLEQSVVSAQYPGRTQFLDELIAKMSSNTKLPSLAEIERLWYEINREMVESGQVVKFPAKIITADGEQVTKDVIRIGAFNLVADGQYISYTPATGALAELARQPRSYTGGAADLQEATSGFTRVGIDPTGPSGGGLLSALIDTPTLVEKWHQGAVVGYIITGVGAFALILALWRFMVLLGVSSKVSAQLQNSEASVDNPLGRVLKVAEAHPNSDAESTELRLHEAVLKERPAIETGLNLLKIIAMVAPLLGLLGTVTGMIVVFQQITIFGAGDPKMMAGGISQALVTTVLGLVVAIPVVLMHTFVNGYAQRILHILEEQSAGIVAKKVEGQ